MIERLEFYHTPKHGTWLNMAEIELSALARQCLNRRIPAVERLAVQIQAWEQQRNHRKRRPLEFHNELHTLEGDI